MKTTGICPKCGSDVIARVAGQQDETSIIVDWGGYFTSAPVARYVCCTCGDIESDVEFPEDLGRIRRKFRLDTPQDEVEVP
ncbi:MAG: hypothetical protein D6709_12070 [Chloroflexi bacterium]|jgi:predicted RNA-binding Zn-ribbon protein involved in translation (DUF1610 family)|uniref:YgiT-type zinc finger domain-containing protein n=1 Tax=Candidatus Thermofonsia Clade 3 bacterium TaxID=2364212 RepID=A0A2M8QBV4_9CHLR|nr:hypothetical protein [Candidatus Roseilinea sp. NK_OTU-006]PJF47275.1 MAG: hypothetical protein CUN48_09465 [Candidatus Thermofonsia Clade 3 bacterium]RMG62243.1 MAG: hypothetical protein D6709_12070 [Chloroflexota bacterium]